jgi:hypothetical protein
MRGVFRPNVAESNRSCTRNIIEFKTYRRFDTETSISFE